VRKLSARLLTATCLTLGATALTVSAASAQEAPVGPPAPVEATPLEVRPSKPLETAPVETGGGIWTKLGLCALIAAGAAALYMKKRSQAASPAPAIRVSARASIGVRSELLLVDVDGHRLLLGVTPSSVRTLSVLPAEPAASEEESAVARFNTTSIGSSFDKLLQRTREEDLAETLRDAVLTTKKPATNRTTRTMISAADDETERAVEGQVVNLARLRNRNKR
jgi:flagellar protein FliO/FliZ